MAIDLTGRVAIVTGAGGGLGRAHAILLAQHGAAVVVNDIGGARDGSIASSAPAQMVADEIIAAGGQAMASNANVIDYEQMVEMVTVTEARWGSVDILINNAGILRDKTFAKMDLADFRAVIDVHLMGSVHAAKAVWAGMCARRYGRIVMTSSSSGLYGNFGQSNYSAAKMGLVGLMKTLSLEGARHNVNVNCLAPSAATRMTDDVLSAEMLDRLRPECVSPAIVALSAKDAPTGTIVCAGGGSFERAYVTLTKGVRVADQPDAATQVLDLFGELSNRDGEMVPAAGPAQALWEMGEMEQHSRLAALT
jgi:NAD(P)-dependent dehydrogenase (short-subunit alcohol dehydrogenase family)